MQRTLILVKPDAVRRSLIGEVLSRFERKGLKIVAMKMIHMDRKLAESHYAVHKDKPFFGELVDFIISGPIVAAVIEGERAIEAARFVMGATDPVKSNMGTIRGDLGLNISNNLVHGSDSEENAAQEIANFFSEKDIVG